LTGFISGLPPHFVFKQSIENHEVNFAERNCNQ